MNSSEYESSKKETKGSVPVKDNINDLEKNTIIKKRSSNSVSLIQRKLSNMKNYIRGEFKGKENFVKFIQGYAL